MTKRYSGNTKSSKPFSVALGVSENNWPHSTCKLFYSPLSLLPEWRTTHRSLSGRGLWCVWVYVEKSVYSRSHSRHTLTLSVRTVTCGAEEVCFIFGVFFSSPQLFDVWVWPESSEWRTHFYQTALRTAGETAATSERWLLTMFSHHSYHFQVSCQRFILCPKYPLIRF